MKVVWSIIAGILICIVIFGSINSKEKIKNSENVEEHSLSKVKPDSSLIVKAKRYFATISKDPDSLTYRNLDSFFDKDGNSYACGEVNAKNSFGGYVGFRKFVYNGKTMILDGESNIPFSELEKKFCVLKELK
ncbi:TPA: hypothetical protein JIU96_07345 [Acinetobacter baumannii]|nr:hypothetical protein [Acinetobacter baumannii]HAV4816683.1 hypothetical protein [Acinetobacter baumannii]HAV4888529.1 hypothetical protein [Acinetobacter baumannii]HAV4905099.1 hypothetical protein [Acinetobacter baumannii]HAV4908865.1 hypothetical protein [Acinetobacter baumannii]